MQNKAFEKTREMRIESLDINVSEYRHLGTGAMHYHLASDNEENVFLVGFRTIPMDSKGEAHILEHTVLCGSEHYPVRDPFFLMIRRSLNTFMNAMTSSDWTAYPFASQNKKDFNNLLKVYLDAVFFPRIDPLDFAQEGYRVEFVEPSNPQTKLQFKGVVFNEMKGAMSSPVSVLWHTLAEHLYPTTTYHYNSGGDPEMIPNLSYDELQAFYKKHYHPSNAVFMTYGNIPAEEHQAQIEELALRRFSKSDDHISVENEVRFTRPLSIVEKYALDPNENPENKTHIVMGWLLGESIDPYESLKAEFLTSVLLQNSSSPLRKALETTSLGSAPSPICGLEDSNREMCFVAGIEGSETKHTAELEKLVMDVLNEVATHGIPYDELDSVLHQLELSQREITGGGYPYGLQLIIGALPGAIHRGDPIALLNLDPNLERLRKDIQDPNFIKNLVRKNLIENHHRLTLTLKPDLSLAEQRNTAEAKRLEEIKKHFSPEKSQEIIQLANQLAARQNETQSAEILPKVTLSDIPPTISLAKGHFEEKKQFKISQYPQGTNGLVYQDIIFDMPQFDSELLDTLPLYTSFISELGVGERSYLDVQKWQAKVSGGLSAYTTFRSDIRDPQTLISKMMFSGKALTRNHADLTILMQETFQKIRFDELSRLKELISQSRLAEENSITQNGHALAMMAASAAISPLATLNEKLSGMKSIRDLKNLDKAIQDSNQMKKFVEQLQEIHQRFQQSAQQFLLIGEDAHLSEYENNLLAHWQNVSSEKQTFSADLSTPSDIQKLFWVTNTQVNFCAKAYKTVSFQHADAPVLTVLAGFLRNGFLHRSIREQGGAYGGGASYDSETNAFRFYSYRDPRLLETLQDFDASLDWLAQEKHTAQSLEEAIIGVIASLDKPASPAGEARKAFYQALYGRTPSVMQHFREQVLKVTIADLQRVANTYLTPAKSHTAVLTNSETAQKHKTAGFMVEVL